MSVQITREHPLQQKLLGAEALAFLEKLHREFDSRRLDLLSARDERQRELDRGGSLGFPQETESVRRSEWRVAETPPDLADRRVEITGPCDRKMMINALNSGASVFVADCEDAQSPTWDNHLQGQQNLIDPVRLTRGRPGTP
jgi:malate synthase